VLLTSGSTVTECPECGAELHVDAQFCASCGMPAHRVEVAEAEAAAAPPEATPAGARAPGAAAAPAAGSETPRDVAPRDVAPRDVAPREVTTRDLAPAAVSPATTVSTAGAGGSPSPQSWDIGAQEFLLPQVPCRLVWSPRRSWNVKTKLSEQEIADLFRERMTKKASLLHLVNSYHRNTSWDVQRNAISGQLVATCKASGLVSVGFGRTKTYVDPSGDTVVLDMARDADGATTVAEVGVGTYTKWLGLYMFPPPMFAYDVVKAVKRADRAAYVRYPWSATRVVVAAILALLILSSVL
jgi:hypothetical protein